MLALWELSTYRSLFSMLDGLHFTDEKAEARRSSFLKGTQLSYSVFHVFPSEKLPLLVAVQRGRGV